MSRPYGPRSGLTAADLAIGAHGGPAPNSSGVLRGILGSAADLIAAGDQLWALPAWPRPQVRSSQHT